MKKVRQYTVASSFALSSREIASAHEAQAQAEIDPQIPTYSIFA